MRADQWAVFLVGGAWGAASVIMWQWWGPWVTGPLIVVGLMLALPPILRN